MFSVRTNSPYLGLSVCLSSIELISSAVGIVVIRPTAIMILASKVNTAAVNAIANTVRIAIDTLNDFIVR